MKFTNLWVNSMSVIVRALLVSVFLYLVISCSNSNPTGPECSSTGKYTIISTDGNYNVDYCIN